MSLLVRRLVWRLWVELYQLRYFQAVRSHHDRHPAARFELRRRCGPALINDLTNRVLGVSLGYPMTFDEAPGVRWHNLFTEQLYAVVHHEHPLAHREVISFEELAGEPFVALGQENTLRRIFDDACARYGITPSTTFQGTDIPTLRGLFGARLGVGVLPKAAVPTHNIVEIAIDDEQLVRPIAVGWMTNRYLPPSAAACRDTVIASYGFSKPYVQEAGRCIAG